MSAAIKIEGKQEWAKFHPKRMGSYSFKFGNQLSSWFYCPVKDEEGFEYRLNLLKGISNYIAISVRIVVGGFGFSIHLDQSAADVLLKEAIPDKFISDVPVSLLKALFLKRFSAVFQYIESEFGYEIVVVSFDIQEGKKRV